MAKSNVNVSEVFETANQVIAETDTAVKALTTQADQVSLLSKMTGFGKRINVPPDEVHYVVGHGLHWMKAATEGMIFGKAAKQPTIYWLNSLTQVVKLKTISFTVNLHGVDGLGIKALDEANVPFTLKAHAVASLTTSDPQFVEAAAEQVGVDIENLIITITQVGTTQLINAAAKMTLQDIIGSRQKLAEDAYSEVNKVLEGLGYSLKLLTITDLGGEAYEEMIRQATATALQETTVKTNAAELETQRNNEEREREEKEIASKTQQAVYRAELAQEKAELEKNEEIAAEQHRLEIESIGRSQTLAGRQNEQTMAQLALQKKQSEVQVENDAAIALKEAEAAADKEALQAQREDQLAKERQERQAAIDLARTETEQERLAAEQAKTIERDNELARAEAERTQEVANIRADQEAAVARTRAQAEADATRTKAQAEADAALTKAKAEAEANKEKASAAEALAEAGKLEAEALQAQEAASGLATAEVSARQVEIDAARVEVTRNEGLAQAEVTKAQAEAELAVEQFKAKLYEQAPVLVEIEQLQMRYQHAQHITTIEANARLDALRAIAPQLNLNANLVGSGGQLGTVLAQVLNLINGTQILTQELPALQGILGHGFDNPDNGDFGQIISKVIEQAKPYLTQIADNVQPRMVASLTVSDFLNELGTVASGETSVLEAVENIRQAGAFRVLGDIPVGQILQPLGGLLNNHRQEAEAKSK